MKKNITYTIVAIVVVILAMVLLHGFWAALIVAICGGFLIDKLLEMTHKNATTGNAVIASLIGIAFFFIALSTAKGEIVCGTIVAVVGMIDLILSFKNK
jgi:CDP-diglyceride synthetase